AGGGDSTIVASLSFPVSLADSGWLRGTLGKPPRACVRDSGAAAGASEDVADAGATPRSVRRGCGPVHSQSDRPGSGAAGAAFVGVANAGVNPGAGVRNVTPTPGAGSSGDAGGTAGVAPDPCAASPAALASTASP